MSAIRNHVLPGTYLDSVALMRISLVARTFEGVQEAALMMATPANLEILRQAGIFADHAQAAGANDLLIAVRASDDRSAERAVAAALEQLDALASGANGPQGGSQAATAPSLERALEALPKCSLALISVPGEYACAEALQALDAGLDVMVFSDNVPVEQERSLKQRASELGRIVMGPDCGTALIGGRALGFANAVPSGDVGVVAASGTGLQELSVLLARQGVGISHGIGVGGRDLSAEVGGLTASAAIDMLAADTATNRLVLLSKPPDDEVAIRVLEQLAACGKPAFACFMGTTGEFDDAAVPVFGKIVDVAQALLNSPVEPLVDGPTRPGVQRAGVIHGLFSGGTLCAEAQAVLLAGGLEVVSNAPIRGAARFDATASASDGANNSDRVSNSGRANSKEHRHLLLDLGADEFTQGRPHPMLEPAVRDQPLRDSLNDDGVAVVLLDVVLGYGAHASPAQAVATLVREARERAGPPDHLASSGSRSTESASPAHGPPPVVAALCGVESDPQGFNAQRAILEAAGIHVLGSTARACEFAMGYLQRSS